MIQARSQQFRDLGDSVDIKMIHGRYLGFTGALGDSGEIMMIQGRSQ